MLGIRYNNKRERKAGHPDIEQSGTESRSREVFLSMKSKREQYIRFVIAYNIVLLIPLVVISFSVLNLFKKQQYHKITDEAAMSLERQESFWKQQVSVIRTFNSFCKYDKKYNELYSDVPKVYLDIQEEFSRQEQNFPFADAIYLYDEAKELVLTSKGNMRPDIFFASICRMDESVLREAADDEIIAVPALLRADRRESIVFIAPIKTWGKQGSEIKYLLYPVRSEKLEPQFGQEVEGGFSVIRFGDEVLYTSEEWDTGEDWNEKYRKIMLEKEYFTYSGELGYGFSSTLFIPRKSLVAGLGFYLRGYGLWLLCSLIIGLILALVFSRSRYEIYKKLLDYNEELTEERDGLRMESCLYEILSRKMQPHDPLWDKCLENSIYINRKYKFFVALPDDLPENRGFYEWFGQQMNLYSVSNAYKIELLEGILIYLICSDETASELKRKIERLSGREVQIGIGCLVTDVSGLHKSYEEARKQLNTFYLKEGSYPEREILSLRDAAEQEDFSREKLLLKEIGNEMKEMDEVTAVGVLWDVARILRIDTRETLEWMKPRTGSISVNAEQFLLEACERLPGDTISVKPAPGYKKRNIVDIITYVHEHYLDDNFSVKYMASYFDTSVSNISHFFKKNMGITISQYVEQIKLERAREMLEKSDLRVSEIARTLRYANSTVFIEMFKKYEGITPGGYREDFRKNGEG